MVWFGTAILGSSKRWSTLRRRPQPHVGSLAHVVVLGGGGLHHAVNRRRGQHCHGCGAWGSLDASGVASITWGRDTA